MTNLHRLIKEIVTKLYLHYQMLYHHNQKIQKINKILKIIQNKQKALVLSDNYIYENNIQLYTLGNMI